MLQNWKIGKKISAYENMSPLVKSDTVYFTVEYVIECVMIVCLFPKKPDLAS